MRYRRIVANSDEHLSAPNLAVDGGSPTGYELGMRKLILPQVGVDGCHWIMHAQKMLSEGSWRIRSTSIDNVPDGREIHWSHGFIWWLFLLGKMHASISGLPLAASIESVSPYANTLLLVLLITSLPWVVYRRFGTIAAIGMALGLPCSYLFFEFFMVGNADHHGIAAGGTLLSVLFLEMGGAGWVTGEARLQKKARNPTTVGLAQYVVDAQLARRYFIGSAIAGSISLWVSAATAVPAFFGIGLGVLISSLLCGRDREDGSLRYCPTLWRAWGIAGCCGSMFFYLLEYFPSHMGMRLEVNHPLYALAWLGAGELLFRFTRWRTVATIFAAERRKPSGFSQVSRTSPDSLRRSAIIFGMAVVCLITLPVLVFSFPERFFWVFDRFLWDLHRDYIHEFHSFAMWIKHRTMFQTLTHFGLFPILVIVNVRLLMLEELGQTWRGMLTLSMTPALLLTVLGIFQVRWLGIASGLWLATIPTILACLFSSGRMHRFNVWEGMVGSCFAIFVFFSQPTSTIRELLREFGKPLALGSQEAFGFFIRDLSHSLRRSNPGKDIVVLSGPTTTTYLMYFGGMRGVGSLYWENLPGLKASAEIYAARSEQEAFELIEKHGVTHIAIFGSDAFAFEYPRLIRGLPFGSEPKDAFIQRVIGDVARPVWLKPIFFRTPAEFSSEVLALMEIRPDQTLSQSHFAWSEYFEARGERAFAIQEMNKVVEREPDHRDAWFRIGTMRLLYEKNAEMAREALARGSAGRKPTEISYACNQLAINMYNASLHAEAAFFFRMSLDAVPDQPSTMNALAWLLATSFDDAVLDPAEALALAERNTSIANKAIYFDTLAAAQAASGKMEEAMASMREAIAVLDKLKPDPENPDPKVLVEHLRKYESGKSIRAAPNQKTSR